MRLSKRETLLIELPEDFNFKLTASAYSFSWMFDGSTLRLLIERDVAVRIGETDSKLQVTCYSRSSRLTKHEIAQYIVDVLGLEERLDDFYNRCARDLILRDPPRGLHMRKCDPWYASLVAVSQQNASFRQGWSMLYRLIKNFGETAHLEDDGAIYAPPSPEKLIRLGEQSLRACGYGYRARVILEIARRFLELGTDDLHKVLQGVRGVGPYTFGLACALSYREYYHPVIDRWVKGLYESLGVRDVYRYFEDVWGSWKALATWMLTIVLDAVPLRKAIERVKRGQTKPTMQGLTPLTMWMYW